MKKQLIEDLKTEKNSAFEALYHKYFGLINHFILQNNGSTDDAKDVFQESLIVFLEKLRRDDFELNASVKTYLMAIAKNLWYKKLRHAYREVPYDSSESNLFYDEIDAAIEKEKTYQEKLLSLFKKITKHCQRLLEDIFYKEKTIEVIQKEYGYSSKHSAQNQKHKCVEQIRKAKAKESQ